MQSKPHGRSATGLYCNVANRKNSKHSLNTIRIAAAPWEIPYAEILKAFASHMEVLESGFWIFVNNGNELEYKYIKGEVAMMITDLEMRCVLQRRRGMNLFSEW